MMHDAVARLERPRQYLVLRALGLDVGDRLERRVEEAVVAGEALGAEAAPPAVGAAHVLDGAALERDGVEGEPERAHLGALDRPVGEVVVEGRLLPRAGLLHEQVVVEEVDGRRAQQPRRDGCRGRVEDEGAEVGVPGPHEHVAVVAPRVAGLRVLEDEWARALDVALGRAPQALDPVAVEEAAEADDAVALEGGQLVVGDVAQRLRVHPGPSSAEYRRTAAALSPSGEGMRA